MLSYVQHPVLPWPADPSRWFGHKTDDLGIVSSFPSVWTLNLRLSFFFLLRNTGGFLCAGEYWGFTSWNVSITDKGTRSTSFHLIVFRNLYLLCHFLKPTRAFLCFYNCQLHPRASWFWRDAFSDISPLRNFFFFFFFYFCLLQSSGRRETWWTRLSTRCWRKRKPLPNSYTNSISPRSTSARGQRQTV